jgi:hypothetical protein
MSEPLVAREVANTEVTLWEEHFGATLDDPSRVAIVQAVMAGRLALDDATEEFTYTLRRPVMLENGGTLAQVKMREPTTGQLRDAQKGNPDDFNVSLRLLCYITGQAAGIMDRIGQKDLTAMAALIGFFG